MRYNELIEGDENDDELFAPTQRVQGNIRRVTFQHNIPQMIRHVQQGLLASADRQARAMAMEFVREANYLEKEEVYGLAREIFTHDAPQHLHQAFAIVSEDPAIIEDEDVLSDTLMTNNIFTNIRKDSDLWIYATEMIEDFAEGDEELEYHLGMEIEGTVGNLIVKLMQEAFASVRALGETRRQGVAEDFGGRKFVEPNFDFEWEEAERYPEFVKLGKDTWIKLARKGKAVTINSAKGISNTDAGDPDSFKLLHPEKQKRALAQLEKGTVEMPIVAVYSDGHKELIGGNTRLTAMMARDGRATVWAFRVPGKQGVAEATDDDDLFSNRPNGKVIAHDLELWLRRRQSGSRRPLSSYSADAITEIITAFNKSFAAGVQAWDVAPIIADLKYDIREYIGSSQHIDIADHVQELNEAPLADYEPIGDFNRPGPFRGVDKKLIPHPTNKLKTARFFEQTPYDFRLFFSNIPGTGRYSEYGPMRPEVVQEIFKDAAEQILAGSENAITVVFVGNKGDSKVMLTPWMMAHRIGHAVQAGTRLAGGRGAWREAENHFFRGINQLLKDFYGKSSNNRYDSDANWALNKEYAALFNAIGTQRSSRTGQIKRPYEFLYELFAQYLGTGKIELNPLPQRKEYGSKAWGRSTQSLRMTPGAEEESKYTTEVLARDMEIMFSDVLGELVGKVLVM